MPIDDDRPRLVLRVHTFRAEDTVFRWCHPPASISL